MGADLSDNDSAAVELQRRKPSTLKRMLIMFALVLILAAGLGFGFYRHIQTLIASAPQQEPATVSSVTAEMSDWQPHIAAVGTLAAVNGVDIATQVSGIVSAIPVKSGATVEANAKLLQLNVDPDLAQLASLEAAAELSGITLKRDSELLARQAVSQSTVDADAADVKSKTALVNQQKALIAEKTVTAPFSGDLGIVQVNLGQYLTPGTVIVTLQDLSEMHVDFLVPQNNIEALAPGLAVNVTLDASPGKAFPGKITAISPKIDPDTRNLTVRATVANPDKILRPGMFVRVAVDAGAPEKHITLPLTALTYNSYGATVFVVNTSADGTAKEVKQTFVTTGTTRGDQVAVLTGVEAGQEIVSSGQLKLKTGAAVVIDNTIQPPNQPNPAPQEN